MRSFSLVLLFLPGCFDFTATQQAGIGGRCGDLDHYCDDGLSCEDDVCIRDEGSSVGEFCSAKVTCGAGLTCDAGQCVEPPGPCDALQCGDHGHCVVDDIKGPVCDCNNGYEAENGFCTGTLDAPCSDSQACHSGFLCSNGVCANPCNNGFCAGGRICDTTITPSACVCPLGTAPRDNQCVDLCDGVACSGRGQCFVQNQTVTCACSNGYVANANGDCVAPNCSPASHATQLCLDNDVYWYDSCGAHEELAQECGVRGCASSKCVPAHWESRDLDLSGLSASAIDASFTITSDRQIVVVVADTDRLRFYVWDGGWGQYSDDVLVRSPSAPVMRVDRSDMPALLYNAGGSVLYRTTKGCTWCALGPSAYSDIRQVSMPDLVFGASGNPVVTGVRAAASSGTIDLVVGDWDGMNWAGLSRGDSTGVSYVGTARTPSAVFTQNGPLFVGWHNDATGQSVINQRIDGVWSQFFAVNGNASPVSLAGGPALMGMAMVLERRQPFSGTSVIVYQWEPLTPSTTPDLKVFAPPNASGLLQTEPSLDITQDSSTRAVVAWTQNDGVYAQVRQKSTWTALPGSELFGKGGSTPLARLGRDLACVNWRDASTPKTFKLVCATLD